MPFTPTTVPRLVIALIVWPFLTFVFFAMAQILFDPESLGSGIRGPLAFFYYLSLIGIPIYFVIGFLHHRKKSVRDDRHTPDSSKSV
jgi:hypothetical protein